MKPSRREILIGSATLPLLASGAVAATADELWPVWQAEWRRMEAIALARNWTVTPVRIARPANARRLQALETEVGLPFPTQLRELMLRFSAKVTFGWRMPAHLMPFERQQLPSQSSFRDFIWDIEHTRKFGIPNFLGWKRDLKDRDLSEAPNRPEMWENQFPISDQVNGDMITIDVTNRDSPQPVRYFSHELEGVHGIALAPDYFTFVTVLSKLGWAGTEQDSWFPFMEPQEGDRRYLSTETEGARNWAAWLAQDPANPPPDEPPAAIVAETATDRALLKAAEARSLPGVRAALAAGARPDVVLHGDDLYDVTRYRWEFATALTHAVCRDDLAMAQTLLDHGATINTRRLASNDAVARGSLETLRWVLAKGGRANGWRYERWHPLHTLLTRRIDETPERVAEQKRFWDDMVRSFPAESRADARYWEPEYPVPVDRATILAMLDALLAAGADPDAPWDNGLTMLMWRPETEIVRRLLAAGAKLDAIDAHGRKAIHRSQSAAKTRVLVAAGANVNELSTPKDVAETPMTLLQYQLVGHYNREPDLIEALLDLGADPTIRDGKGGSSLAHCFTRPDFDRMLGFGLDPKERMADGSTHLLRLVRQGSLPRQPHVLALIDRLLALGVAINEPDRDGQAVLHALAGRSLAQPEDVRLLAERGADKELRDRQGRRPFDLARKSDAELREALQ